MRTHENSKPAAQPSDRTRCTLKVLAITCSLYHRLLNRRLVRSKEKEI